MTESGQGTRRRTIAVVAIVALLALIAGAWAFESLAADESESLVVRVTRDGNVLATFTLEELHEMETSSFSQYGIPQTGPRLLSVLEAAGVEDFDRLTIVGPGIRDDGELTLERGQITDDVILDFAATRPTVKIAGPGIVRAERVRDVTELRVE